MFTHALSCFWLAWKTHILKQRLSKYYESLTVKKKVMISSHYYQLFFPLFHCIIKAIYFVFVFADWDVINRKWWFFNKSLPSSTCNSGPLMICNGSHSHLECNSASPFIHVIISLLPWGLSAAVHPFGWPICRWICCTFLPVSPYGYRTAARLQTDPPKCMFTCRCSDRPS